MKTIFYILAISALVLVTACKSVEKLVDQGRYDEAIVLATKRLAGKKNKKTKHIRALEDAFGKVNQRDLDHIKLLQIRNDQEAWEEVYNYAMYIQNRQRRITPFLPLISKDNYLGSFELVKTEPILSEASTNAARLLYEAGKSQLAEAKVSGDKLMAQEAFYQFEKIGRYFTTYEDVLGLMDESKTLGTFHLLLRMDHSVERHIAYSARVGRQLVDLDTDWTQHYYEYIDGVAFDAVSTLFINNIDISPEKELVNTFTERKELERWVNEVDENGNVIRDSLGQVLRYREVEKVRADITEIFRTKSTIISGSVETKDYITGDIISRDNFTHNIDFASEACDLIGDRRAISDGARKSLDFTLLPFPRDIDMIFEGVDKLVVDYVQHLKRLNLPRHYRKSLAFN